MKESPIKRIVLVHGAAHGAWCWERVTPLLEAKGYEVQTLDLPGLGDDPTQPKDVTMESYANRVIEALRSRPVPALLVGHSMGGAPISLAAEAAPETVAKLVYLTAFMLQPGESLAMIAQRNAQESDASASLQESDVEDAQEFDPVTSAKIFYNRCDPETARKAVARLRPQAVGPIAAPLNLTAEHWGALPKTYIICNDDRALPVDAQRWLCSRMPDVKTREMDTDHSPFYSDPQGLVAILDEEARFA